MEWLDPIFYLDWIPDYLLIRDMVVDVFSVNSVNILVGPERGVWDEITQDTQVLVAVQEIGGDFPARVELYLLANHIRRPTTLQDIEKIREALQTKIVIEDADSPAPSHYILVQGKNEYQPIVIDDDTEPEIVILEYR